MSFDQLLIHKAQVYRRKTVDGKQVRDRLGQVVTANPRQHEVEGETLFATYPCRANRAKGGLLMEERFVDTFQQRWTVYLKPNVDLISTDAMQILDENGNVLAPLGKIQIKAQAAGMTGAHHLEVELWVQEGVY